MALLEKHSTKTAEFNDKIAELKAQVEQNNKLVQVKARGLFACLLACLALLFS